MIPIYNLTVLLIIFVSISLTQGFPHPTDDLSIIPSTSSSPTTKSPTTPINNNNDGSVVDASIVDNSDNNNNNNNVDSYLMAGNNQWSSIYSTHNNFMLDQERGTYVMQTYYTSRWSSISTSTISGWKKNYYNTLVLLLITLDNYKSSDISSTTLTQIHNEFQIYRSAGVKTIIRFIYSDNMGTAKPWGDATSATIVFRHIDQLQPILRINEDVIAYVQGGFVGLWGEWYYTDSFGDQNTQTTQNKADRKTVISKLMAALPNRAVQVRTPYWMKNFYGSTPLQAPNYQSELGRAGHHNDCFLADSSDMGTYDNYAADYGYLSQQSKFTPTIFETCATSSRSLCPTALKESAGLHMVSGHRSYNTAVWNQWIAGGCYDTILKNMGHRFEFVSSTSDLQTNIGSSFSVNVNLRNVGYASPSNSRKTELILRNVDGSSYCVATLPFDARTLQSQSSTIINSIIRMPATVTSGRYELLMHFADPYSTLYGVPWYKIQAANSGIYESGTGFHKLNAVIDVLSPFTSTATQLGEVTAKCGLSLSSLINSTITSADTSCMPGYYKFNNVCTYCPPGSSCVTAISTPVQCSTGTYSAGGQSACLTCPSTCSGRGTCSTKTGACLCSSGFQGYDCSIVAGSTFAPTVTPTTVTPTTVKPSTAVPTALQPTTIAPTTLKPSTIIVYPTTLPPITSRPATTAIPVTSTAKPTNVIPTTVKPPTTTVPTTTTIRPTTSKPTTSVIPTTAITPSTVSPTGCPKQTNLLMNPAFGVIKEADGSSTATAWDDIGNGYDVVYRREYPSIKLSSFNVNRNVGAIQSLTLAQPTLSKISFGAYISTAYVSGSMDYKFSLQLTLTYDDSTTENKSIYLATGSYGWRFRSMTFTPTKPVTKIDFKFSMIGHTGYAYMSQPVLGTVQTCAIPLVTGDSPLQTSFESPIAFEGVAILADNGSDADSALVDTEESGFSMMYIVIIAGSVGGLLLIGMIVGFVLYRKRRADKLDAAINNQLTSV